MSTDSTLKLSDLHNQGFQGLDKSLSVSLLDQGFAWKEEGKDFKFLYRVPDRPNAGPRFEFAYVRKNVDPKKEWNWVDWNSLADWAGVTDVELLNEPLPQVANHVYNYYGADNAFGTCYWEGHKLQDDLTPANRRREPDMPNELAEMSSAASRAEAGRHCAAASQQMQA